MIIDKYCTIKINSKNIEYYKIKGYDTENKEIEIETKDLTPGSHKVINVKCDICNKEKSITWKEYYKSYSNGFLYCCSSKCSQYKNKKTNLERYGVDNPTKSKDILKKREESNIKKYGVKNTLELKSVKESIKKTNIEKYGVDNPTKNKDIYKKVRKTINEKFGNEVFFKTNFFKDKKENYYRQYNNKNFLENRISELKYMGIDMISVDSDNKYIISCTKGHTYSITNDVLYKRVNVYNVEPCTICNKIDNFSYKELELYDFIKSIYNGVVLRNVRDVIKPYEIDIFIPDLKIGIEFNGVFWHSDRYKDKDYHKSKHDKSVESGIKLIQIWEDDWVYKRDIIKSILENKLKLTKKRIFARKCQIIKYDNNKLTKSFLEKNHLQGDCKSNIKIGLLFNDELVALMTFSKNRYGVGHLVGDNYELTRFVTKKGLIVVGGASKLLNFFKKNYEFETLISFSDCDISDGDMYLSIGFKLHSFIKPTYYYIINGKREHRFKWRKGNLLKKGIIKENETEFECMDRIKISRVYNSGHRKFIIKSI
jgi:hypothetical protein